MLPKSIRNRLTFAFVLVLVGICLTKPEVIAYLAVAVPLIGLAAYIVSRGLRWPPKP